MSIWRGLSKRRTVQVLFAYLAAAWLVLEGFDQLTEHGILPEVAYQVAFVLFLAGIPASLTIGWFHGEKGAQKAPPLEWTLLSLIAVLAVGSVTLVVRASLSDEEFANVSTLDPHGLAILYFEEAGDDEELAAIAAGLTEALIDQFRPVVGLRVISRNGVAPYVGTDLARDSIARALNVGTLVEGSIGRNGTSVRLSVSLVDGASGADFRREAFEWPQEEVTSAPAELADALSLVMREWLGDEVRLRERRAGTQSVSSWVLVQQAEKFSRDAETALDHDDVDGAWDTMAKADSLLSEAHSMDTTWIEPLRLRASVAYERSWLAGDLDEAVSDISAGLELVDRALERDAGDPESLSLRGTLRYRLWLLGTVSDPNEAWALLQDARADLEAAAVGDPTLASANSILSHLYYQTGDRDDLVSAVLAARKAYEQDPYLRAVDAVLWRLYSGSYDLEQPVQAERWCEEGARRFPDNFRFVDCQLWRLTMAGVTPDVDLAWELAARRAEMVPEPQREYYVAEGAMIVAGVLARAALPDSARSVASRSRVGPDVDPQQELLWVEAMVRTFLGDADEAVSLLSRYTASNPGHFEEGGSTHWWWRGLQSHDGFRRLTGATS
jgi:TolB-like protein